MADAACTSSPGQHTQGPSEWVPTRDGRRLHAKVLPGPQNGSAPTVIFEAGAAADRSSWALVQPAVARFARAVVYDRSGLGRSPADPTGRTLDRMADDLGDVLTHFGAGRYILVGHSAGGSIVRLTASRHPEQVAGLVLADPTDESADFLFGRLFRRTEGVAIGANRTLARLGALKRMFRSLLRAMPADVRADMERESFAPGVFRTQADQSRTLLDEIFTWRAQPPALGDIPVTVISGARAGDGMNARVRKGANESHARRAAASPSGRHVVAEHSAHYVPITDADLVVAEIRRLVGRE